MTAWLAKLLSWQLEVGSWKYRSAWPLFFDVDAWESLVALKLQRRKRAEETSGHHEHELKLSFPF